MLPCCCFLLGVQLQVKEGYCRLQRRLAHTASVSVSHLSALRDAPRSLPRPLQAVALVAMHDITA